jgi:PAS domain-containing protein
MFQRMNYQKMPKENLIAELQLLQQNYNSLKELYNADCIHQNQVEHNILNLNRVLAFISQINQMIVRTRGKNELFEKSCQIAIEHGKFQMAWIGLVDKKTKLVNPFTFAGVEDGYLSKISKISIGDIPEGQGPTGKAIREGIHFVCDDITTDSRMTPWKDEALARNYRSSIALPILQNNEVIGAFTLYATSPYFFDNEEIILLNEVTNNISFALESIEAENKRKNTENLLIKSEEKYRIYIDQSPEAIFIADDEGNYVDVNNTACSMLGYNRAELLSLSIFDLSRTNKKGEIPPIFHLLKNVGHINSETLLVKKKR